MEFHEYYLLEARSCFKSKAFRMAVVAAQTSVYTAVFYILYHTTNPYENKKLPYYKTVIDQAKNDNILSDTLYADAEWLMHTRNAFAHPEEWISIESKPVKNNLGISLNELDTTINFQTDPTKGHALLVSQSNSWKGLKELAEKSIDKAENIFRGLGLSIILYDSQSWKQHLENQIDNITGQSINLEDI